jgi:hypothetical protein
MFLFSIEKIFHEINDLQLSKSQFKLLLPEYLAGFAISIALGTT